MRYKKSPIRVLFVMFIGLIFLGINPISSVANAQDITEDTTFSVDNQSKTLNDNLNVSKDINVTFSAINSGTYIINSEISGNSDGYNLFFTGDLNSDIHLNNQIKYGNVNVNRVNIFINKDTFQFAKSLTLQDCRIILSDSSVGQYVFPIIQTAVAGTTITVDFNINGNNADSIYLPETSTGVITVGDINFIDGFSSSKQGTYKLLDGSGTGVTLQILNENRTASNIRSTINWDEVINVYEYKLTLNDSKTIKISDIYPIGIQDNLNALNTYKTNYNRSYNFNNYDNEHIVSANTGITSNLSSLTINGFGDNGQYSTINYQNGENRYSGFVLENGASITVNNVEFKNAKSTNNGAVFNMTETNTALVYNSGRISLSESEGNGGAIYITGNSFLTINNVEFYKNKALSGGALYSDSDENNTPAISNISGVFKENNASILGGAIVNTAYSTISTLNALFENNSVTSENNDTMGGAIYNSGTIETITGDFKGNTAQSSTIAKGGAIYNEGTISKFSGNLENNKAISNTDGAKGGAIYTTSSMLLEADNQNYKISGNQIVNNGESEAQAIYMDNSEGVLSISTTDGGSWTIDDIISGTEGYRVNINLDNQGKISLNNKIENANVSIFGGITSEDDNAEVIFSGNTFSDNTTLEIRNAIVNLQTGSSSEKYTNYQIGSLTSFDNVSYKIDIGADIDADNNIILKYDTISVGKNSKGTIKITDIGISKDDLFQFAKLIYQSSEETQEINILNKEYVHNDIKIILDENVQHEPTPITIENTYFDDTTNTFIANEDSFVGSFGYKINELTNASITIGVLEKYDPLKSLNIFIPESGIAANRVFNLGKDYTVFETVGETAIGTMTLNGNNYTLDLNNEKGFILNDSNAKIIAKDLTITNAPVGIESRATISEDEYNIELSNVIFKDNAVSISNIDGRVYMDGVNILSSADDNSPNTLINSGDIKSKDSNFYSSIENDGNIVFDGSTNIGKQNYVVDISGKGTLSTTDSAVSTDLRYVLITDPDSLGKYNSFTLNSGKLQYGTSTFSNSKLTLNKGVIDFSGTSDGSFGNIDMPYTINSLTINPQTVGSDDDLVKFIIDVDFRNNTADRIIVKDLNSTGIINISEIHGVAETLTSTTQEGDINILTGSENVKVYIKPFYNTFYVDTYTIVGEGYVLYDDYFVGEIHISSNGDGDDNLGTGIKVEKKPVYNGIVELNRLGLYSVDQTLPRTFILRNNTVAKPYEVPANIGETVPGKLTIKADEGITTAGNVAKIDMNNFGGFEIYLDNAEKYTTLTINGVSFENAKTYNQYEYTEEYSKQEQETTTLRSEKRGSVIFMNSANNNASATIIDSVMSANAAEGIGGAIYTTNTLSIIAENRDTILSENYQNKNDDNIKGEKNDIYLGADGNQTLNLIAHNGKSVQINSGLEISDNTLLTLNINDNSTNNGTVKLTMPKSLGSKNYINSINLNGGKLDVADGYYTTIYTNDLNVNSNTELKFDVNLRQEQSDKIVTDKLRTNSGNGLIILTRESFNILGKTEVDSVSIKLLDIKAATTDFLKFSNGTVLTNAILLYTIDDKNYYAKIGLNGSIIVGYDPDCEDTPIVSALLDTKAKTVKLNEDMVIFNYGKAGTLSITSGKLQSKKLTIKGDSYSTISTPNELEGFVLDGTEKIKVSKQQLVGSNFDIKGFNGAFINNGGKISLSNVNLTDNETDNNGAGIRNNAGTAILKGTKKKYAQVYRNTSTNGGGAIYNNGTLSLNYVQFGETASGSTTYGNEAYIGGAVYNENKATISNSKFTSNTAELIGGAIYTAGYSKFTSNTFTFNTAPNGGAIYINALPTKKTTVNIAKNNFYSNNSTENGGAIYIKQGKVSISKSNFGSAVETNNGNISQNGGAIYNSPNNVPEEYQSMNVTTVSSSTFVYNEANNGGAIYNDGKMTLKSNNFGITDKAKNEYGNTAKIGGALYNTGSLTDSSSKFYYNTASDKGGAIYNNGEIITYNKKGAVTGGLNSSKIGYNNALEGGGIYNNKLLATSKASFTENKADVGGGLYNSKDSNATIISSSFFQNSANYGGAIYNNGTLTVNKSTFGKAPKKEIEYSNTANDGGAIYNNSLTMVTGSTFAYNKAVDKGGAIYTSDNSVLSINSSNFKNNRANYGGAIYVGENAFAQIADTNFTNNIAEIEGGALYLDKNSTTNILAIKKNVTFSNNTVGEGELAVSNAIHMDNATLNLQANKNRKITVNDLITGEGEIHTSGNVIIKRQTEFDSGINIYNDGSGALVFEDEATLSGRILNLSSNSTTSFSNNKLGRIALKSLALPNDTVSNIAIDADLKSGASDKITAENVEGTGTLNVSSVNLTSNSKDAVTINLGEDSLVSSMSATTAE
ncbi:hypothetical protein J6O48_13200, partial [bacterium]|nr:hypothetical protein [bacterium]